MKVAITASGQNPDSQIDLRFGRARGFIIYDLDNDSYQYVDNTQNLNAMQGAGIQAAQNIVNQDVEALITGHCGPKAFSVLSSANVKIFTGSEGTVQEALEKYKNNDLQEATSADVEGHWV
jgi:predicted Fe-Mo cluster-binding NifX family protein